MLQRRSTVSLVVITAIAVVVATVAVVYALQTIFQTREVTATVNVVPLGASVRSHLMCAGTAILIANQRSPVTSTL